MTPHASTTPIPFDPVAGDLPDGVLVPPRSGGEVVALLVDPGTGMDGWSLRVGRGIARGWSAQGRQVVLVDGHVEDPGLHRLLGAGNGEGITDVIRFGVSRTRATRALDDEDFQFVSAGTVLPHHREFWRSRRWGAVLDGYRADDRVVLLFLPAGDPDVEGVVRGADRAFWVGRADAPERANFPGARPIVPVHAGAGHAGVGEGPVAGKASQDRARDTGTPPRGLTGPGQESLASRPDRSGSSEASAPKAREARGGTQRSRTGAGRPRPVARRRAGPWVLLILLLALGGAAVGHFFGVFTIPGLPIRTDPLWIALPHFLFPSG